ncbi:FAD-dependent monooxygenase [Streptomyces sp. CLV115]|uniref:FAD-dependent monooxygenase n=1 Tax=Streptomyces sp. CLV115 TaxID=3138502 RepID=UPI00313AA87A
MKLSRIAILGGGPGGLFAGRLLKLRYPKAVIDVYEQSPPDYTFGFGVGLPAGAQRNLRAVDAATVAAIEAVGRCHDAAMHIGSRTVRFADFSTIAIARTELLRVLRGQAEEVGVRVHFGDRISVDQLDAELIIAADGVNSATRERFSSAFGAHVKTSAGLYLWCGTEFALDHAMFAPCSTADGTFVTHAYPYAEDASTFLIETDETTWRRAGFNAHIEFSDPAASDEKSLTHLQSAFSEILDGRRLVGNRTRWLRFRTVRCRTWHHRNIVLLGDAAHTAHYSIGSGTKLAMEDAIELDRSLADAESLTEALETYAARRHTAVTGLQDVARRSELWWETFPQRIEMPIEQLMVAYMTRAGKVPLDRFLETTPAIARRGLAQYAGARIDDVPTGSPAEWVLDRPLHHPLLESPTRWYACGSDHGDVDGSHVIDGRDITDAEAVAALALQVRSGALWADDRSEHVERAALSDRDVVWLHGSDERDDVLDRLEVGDDIRRRTTKVVAVSAPGTLRADLAAALASGRIDIAIETGGRGDGPFVARRIRR